MILNWVCTEVALALPVLSFNVSSQPQRPPFGPFRPLRPLRRVIWTTFFTKNTVFFGLSHAEPNFP